MSNWNNMAWNAQLLLARLTGAPPLLEATKGFLDGWRFGKVVNVTAGGLAYADDWGTLRNSANSALLALVYAKHVGKEKGAPYACWAQVSGGGREGERGFFPLPLLRGERERESSTHLFSFFFYFFLKKQQKQQKQSQLRYMLGDGARGWSRGRSFLVGNGRQSPPATCNYLQLHSKDPNRNVLVGALVGGPFFNDSFPDDRMDYAKSEVVRFFFIFSFRVSTSTKKEKRKKTHIFDQKLKKKKKKTGDRVQRRVHCGARRGRRAVQGPPLGQLHASGGPGQLEGARCEARPRPGRVEKREFFFSLRRLRVREKEKEERDELRTTTTTN